MKMKIIAHRGHCSNNIENSWMSFYKAIESKCDMIELDLRMAKDGSLWIMHDDSLKKTCGLDLTLSNMNKKDILAVKLLNKESIPNFEDVLTKILPKININVEIKESSQKFLDTLIPILKKCPYLDKILLSSFNIGALEYISQKIKTLQLAFLWGEDNEKETDPIDFFKTHPNFFFHPQADCINWKLMHQIHKKNVTVFPWVPMQGVETQNRHELWEVMKSFKVHGLCTNFPEEFKKWQEQSLIH